MSNTVDHDRTSVATTLLWSATHRNGENGTRLHEEGKLQDCDELGAAVARHHDTWSQLVSRRQLFQRDPMGSLIADMQAFFGDRPSLMFGYGQPQDEIERAWRGFEILQDDYNRRCLGKPETTSTPAQDLAFIALDLPATIGGELQLSEPPLKTILAWYGVLGLAFIVPATALGLAAGIELVPFFTELAPISSGLRLVTP